MQADFENYKKRMIKQQTDHLERAAEALVDKLLPVLDTADLALAHGGGEEVKQLTSAARRACWSARAWSASTPMVDRSIPPSTMPWPTNRATTASQEVVEVLRAGYRWKGRVLRPAMVKVRG